MKLTLNKILIIFLLCSMTFFSMVTAHAQTQQQLATQAGEAYQAGNYAEAFQDWQVLAEQGVANSALYTNLGLAAWQQGLQGQALRWFLKAKQLAPRDVQLRHNLGIVQEALGQSSNGNNIPLLKLPWWRLALSYYETLAVVAVATVLFFMYLLRRLVKGKTDKSILGFVLLVFWCFSLSLWAFQAWQILPKRAVVIAKQAEILEAPTLEAPSGETFSEGQVVQVERSQGNFKLVKTDEEREVWVAGEALGTI